MTAVFPSFNLASRCPKCGMEGGQPGHDLHGHHMLGIPVTLSSPFPVEYHAPYPVSDCSVETGGREHLHRTCPRCGFGWAEALPQFPDQPVTPAIPHVRPEVWRFALLMERELARHDDRPGWKHTDPNWLFTRLLEEAEELRQTMIDLGGRGGAGARERAEERIGPEAADIANFAMFIADVAGALATGEVKA